MGSGSLTNDATYTIELSGSKTIPYYQLISEKLEVIDMMFDSIEDAKQYAKSKGLSIKESHVS
ncbi:hypothetical protein JCM30760_26350 [Thiomicrorhabdus hydrogeniphila]